MDQQERLRAQREGGYVRRCHNTPIIGDYTVGHHSFNMLILAYELCGNPSPQLIKAITYHDLAERWTGDIPAPALLENPEIRDALKGVEAHCRVAMGCSVQLTEREQHWLKCLDKLEHWLFCHDQVAMGNRHVMAHKLKLDEIFEQMRLAGEMPQPINDFIREFEWKRGTDGLPV